MDSRAVVYVRMSNDPEGAALGVERQEEDCRALAGRLGLEVITVFGDNDISASTLTKKPRPGYMQMLERAKAGEFGTILAYSNSRLTRRPLEYEGLISLHQQHATVIRTVVSGDHDLSTADGRAVARTVAAWDAAEAERIAERSRRANRQRAVQGKRTGASRRQFGYAKDGVTVIDAEAAAVRAGYDALLSGVSLAGIARDWNQRGLATTQKRQARSGHAGESSAWRHDNVRAALLNPRYAGIVTYQGAELRSVNDAQGTAVEVLATWPAIVDEATFRAAEALLNNPARRSSAVNGGGKYLLSGIALCGTEGCDGHAHAGGAARPGVRAYRCSASNGHFARKAEPVEDYVAALVIERLSRSDARELLIKPGVDTRALHQEILVITHRIAEVVGLVGAGTLTGPEATPEIDHLKAQRAELEGRIADAGRTDILGPLVGAASPKAAWTELGTDRQRAVIDLLMTVTLHGVGRGTRTFRPETVGIDWKTA